MRYNEFKEKSQFNNLSENWTYRYQNGGVAVGDFIKINKKALTNPVIKTRPEQFLNLIKSLMNSDIPLKIACVHTPNKATSSNEGYLGTGALEFTVDVVQEPAPGLFVNPITLPLDVVDIIDVGIAWSPDHPESIKYKNKEKIKPEVVKIEDGESAKQTLSQDVNRKTTNKNTKGSFAKEPVDGRKQIENPVKYESVNPYLAAIKAQDLE